MARIARVVVPDYPHHVTQRGNRRQPTFLCEDDYATYLSLMAASCAACGTEVLAYCLMPNHVHLIMVPHSQDGLRAAIADVHRRYTRRINSREGWTGHLWQDRFHSFVLDEAQLLAAVRYIENNPVRAGLCNRPEEWAWSSARAHLAGTDDALVRVAPLQGLVSDWAAFLGTPSEPALSERLRLHMQSGRPLGSDEFIADLERRLARTLRPRKPGPKPRPKDADKAPAPAAEGEASKV